jgi:hypothetical protein
VICDSQGIPFYSQVYNEFTNIDDTLLSGLISAIGSIGKTLFKKEIATISFGADHPDDPKVVIVSKELFNEEKSIYFVFFLTGDVPIKKLREVATLIFMETKNNLKMIMTDRRFLAEKINKLIETRFPNMNTW